MEPGAVAGPAEAFDIESQEPQEKKVSCCGRAWADKGSQIPLVGIATLSTAALIAGAVLGDWRWLFGAGVGLVGGTVLGCARIACLKPYKNFEDNVLGLGEVVNEDLPKEVERLTKNIAALTKERDLLQKTFTEAKQEVAALRQLLDEKTGALEEIAAKLQATEEKLRALETLYEKFKAETAKLAKETRHFNKIQKVFHRSAQDLADGVDALGKNEDSLSEEVDQFGEANGFFVRQNQELKGLMGAFRADMQALRGSYDEMKHLILELGKYAKSLDDADDKFLAGANRLNELLPSLEVLLQRYEEEIEQLVDVDASLGGTELIEEVRGKEERNDAVDLPLATYDAKPPNLGEKNDQSE